MSSARAGMKKKNPKETQVPAFHFRAAFKCKSFGGFCKLTIWNAIVYPAEEKKKGCGPRARGKLLGISALSDKSEAWTIDDKDFIFSSISSIFISISCIYLGEDNWLKATSEWQALLAAEEISIEVPGKSGRVFDVSLMNSYLVFAPHPPMHWFNLPAIYIRLQLPALIAAIKCCRCGPQNEILASESRQLASPAKTNLPKCLWFLWSKECAR